MILITLKEYLELHPEEGVELLTEYSYYTVFREEIKTRLTGAARCSLSLASPWFLTRCSGRNPGSAA